MVKSRIEVQPVDQFPPPLQRSIKSRFSPSSRHKVCDCRLCLGKSWSIQAGSHAGPRGPSRSAYAAQKELKLGRERSASLQQCAKMEVRLKHSQMICNYMISYFYYTENINRSVRHEPARQTKAVGQSLSQQMPVLNRAIYGRNTK